jgi:hypothetical protein
VLANHRVESLGLSCTANRERRCAGGSRERWQPAHE